MNDQDFAEVQNRVAADIRREVGLLLDCTRGERSMMGYRLDRIVSFCSEFKALAVRDARDERERAEHPREAVPVVEIGDWRRA